MEDKPFTYDDEVKYFGELSLYSAALLTDLGYLDASGKWIKQKPKMSFLCELIRTNRQQFMWEGNDSSFSFAGIPREFNKTSYEWPIDGQVVFVQCKENTQNINVILFYYRIPQQKIDFPIYINGDALSQKLGFKTVGNKPTLDASKLKLLQKLDTH